MEMIPLVLGWCSRQGGFHVQKHKGGSGQCAYRRVGERRRHREDWIQRNLHCKGLEGHEKNIFDLDNQVCVHVCVFLFIL